MKINTIKPFGEVALLIEFVREDNMLRQCQHIQAIGKVMRTEYPDIVNDTIAGFASLSIIYDHKHYDPKYITALIKQHLEQCKNAVYDTTDHLNIKVDTEPNFDTDWDHITRTTRLSRGEIKETLTQQNYHVLLNGFMPGFAYMGILPQKLIMTKRANPRKNVPQGSVAISGEFIGIYPQDGPGGWHIIGHCDLPLVSESVLLRSGMTVRLELS